MLVRPVCWLGAFGYLEHGAPMTPCSGRLIRAHLIPKQLIKREGGDPWDPRSWVPSCGGLSGNGGHHGMLDASRTLKLRRDAIPPQVEELASELGVTWWLDREYGLRLQ